MISCRGPSTSGAADSGVRMQRYMQAERSWSYKGWLRAGFCPDSTDPPEREYHAGNTSGAQNRLGTHSRALVLCDTQTAEPSR